jgi:hypothetical protein
MSAPKNLLKRGVALALEAGGYNAGGAINTATDGFHVHDDFEVEPQYQFTGERQGTAAGTSMQFAEAKQGRWAEFELAHRVRPAGAAYSSSLRPTVDRVFRAHGMLATGSFTGGSEKFTYTVFTDGTWESLFGDLYTGKEKASITGGYVPQWTHKADRLSIPEWRFTVRAPVGLPSDSAVVAITYPNTAIAHPKGAGSTFTITATGGGGAFQGLVRESTVTSKRDIDERMSQVLTAGGHAGFQLGRYTQTIEALVEATNLTASPYSTTTLLDPYRLAENGGQVTALLGFNQSVQYQRYKFLTGNSAQVVDVKRERDGAIRLWRLTINCTPSTELADDGLSAVFD